jgi:hypothetical protein
MKTKFNEIVMMAGMFVCSIPGLKSQVIAIAGSASFDPKTGEAFQAIGIENTIPPASLSLQLGLNDGAPSTCKLDITPTGFHHAYLAHQVAPMIGVDFVRQPVNGDIPSYSYGLVKGGLKFSTNRLMGGIEYGMQPIRKGPQFITIRMAYVIGLTHDCLRKRIHQQNMSKFLQF